MLRTVLTVADRIYFVNKRLCSASASQMKLARGGLAGPADMMQLLGQPSGSMR